METRHCYLLEKDGEIKAFGVLWNQKHYKQYIAVQNSGYMKRLSYFPAFASWGGYAPIPRLYTPLNFPILSLFYAKENDTTDDQLFLSSIAGEIKKNYSIFVTGIAVGHPNHRVYQKIKSFSVQSVVYYVKYNKEIIVDQHRPVHLECGLL